MAKCPRAAHCPTPTSNSCARGSKPAPAPEEVAACEADTDPAAYDNLVSRLLDSPRYGEHWARHWLDVVRFAESNGFEYDEPRRDAWLYRDWVIDALNDDLPFDEFCRWQIAGDVGFRLNGFPTTGAWLSYGLGNDSDDLPA